MTKVPRDDFPNNYVHSYNVKEKLEEKEKKNNSFKEMVIFIIE